MWAAGRRASLDASVRAAETSWCVNLFPTESPSLEFAWSHEGFPGGVGGEGPPSAAGPRRRPHALALSPSWQSPCCPGSSLAGATRGEAW